MSEIENIDLLADLTQDQIDILEARAAEWRALDNIRLEIKDYRLGFFTVVARHTSLPATCPTTAQLTEAVKNMFADFYHPAAIKVAVMQDSRQLL